MNNPSLAFDQSAQKASFDHKARTQRQDALANFWKKSSKSQILFQDYELICDRAAYLRQETLSQLDAYLQDFEAQFSSYGQIHWVDHAPESQKILERILANKKKPNWLNLSQKLAPELGLDSSLDIPQETSNSPDTILLDVQFLIAENGQIALDLSPLSGYPSTENLPDFILLAGIEQVLPKVEHLGTFWPLLAHTQRAHLSLASYQLIGRNYPGKCYLLLIDHGRSALLAQEKRSEILRCIHCGICQKKCPVIQTPGPAAFPPRAQSPYDWITAVHYPQTEPESHFNYSCTLCQACDEACPVRINLSQQILLNRKELLNHSPSGRSLKQKLNPWKWLVAKRKRFNSGNNWWKHVYYRSLARLRSKQKMNLPELVKKNLGVQWAKEVKGSEKK